MNFGSKFVYDNTEEEEYEYVSDDEFEEGLNVSDEDEDVHDSSATPASGGGLTGRIKTFFKKKKHHWQKEAETADGAQCPPPRMPNVNQKRCFRKADTNVVSVMLNTLKNPSNMHAGDAVRCGGSECPAVMSKWSKLTAGMSGKVWVCEFCGTNNEVDVEDGEIPKEEDVTFLLEAAPATESAGPTGFDESIVVFCIDVSGSMCVTTEVPGHITLRSSSSLERSRRFNVTGEDQFLPNQKRNVTNISRLESMQAAVDKQLEDIRKDFPDRRVAIIAFNNELRIMDDGVNTDKIIAGKKLDSLEELGQIGAELALPKPIKETKTVLSNKVFELEEGGGTALGPSLVVAMGLASRYSGSMIILCTDGLANVGLGQLDDTNSQADQMFYENMAESAVDKGVSISVVTIKGNESKLVQLGKLADKTNGQVNHVDPLKLTEEFSNILADRIIATNVTATVILHKNLVFLDEETENNVIVKNIGNARTDTEITFKYGRPTEQDTRRKTIEAQKVLLQPNTDPTSSTSTDPTSSTSTDPTSSTSTAATSSTSTAFTSSTSTAATSSTSTAATSSTSTAPTSSTSTAPSSSTNTAPTELPFQLQLEYTDTIGTKALRVLTQKLQVTQNRELAEKHINLEVLGPYTAQTTANLALKGEYSKSRGIAFMNHRLAWRTTRSEDAARSKLMYNKMFNKIKSADLHVASAQKSEISRFGRDFSDDDDDEDEVDTRCKKESCVVSASASERSSLAVFGKKRMKKLKRTDEVSDEMASDMYNFKQSNVSNLMS